MNEAWSSDRAVADRAAGDERPPGATAPDPGSPAGPTHPGRALVVGLVMAITLIGLELLGIAAAMPVITTELDGDALYGAVFSAFALAQVVAIAVAGHLADRRSIARTFAVGLGLLTVGLCLAAAAPTMELLVGARVVQGLGAGTVSTVVFVAVNRAFGPERRPTVLALVSAAWVAPALVAPPVAGFLAEELSWRWVFAGIVPVVPVVAGLTLGPLSRLDTARRPIALGRPVGDGLLVAAGIGLAQVGLSRGSALSLVVVAPVGVALAVVGLRRLLPASTLTPRTPLGAAVWVKLLVGAGFFGSDYFIPEALTEIHGLAATRAGLTLTAGSVAWTIGSVVQARTVGRFGPRRLARSGIVVLAAGVTALAGMLDSDLAWWWALVVWSIAPIGMGLAFNSANATAMDHARTGEEGQVSTALSLADVIGVAVAAGVGGAVLANGEREAWPIAEAIGIIGVLMLASLLTASVVARRLPTGPGPGADGVAT